MIWEVPIVEVEALCLQNQEQCPGGVWKRWPHLGAWRAHGARAERTLPESRHHGPCCGWEVRRDGV